MSEELIKRMRFMGDPANGSIDHRTIREAADALEAISRPAPAVQVSSTSLGVPDAEQEHLYDNSHRQYARGWNACRDAMLKALRQPITGNLAFDMQINAGPDAAPAPATVATEAEHSFGNGEKVVCRGTHGGRPAVFIAPAKMPGAVGEDASRENATRDRLVAGEIVLTFPTEAQAVTVEAALLNVATEAVAQEDPLTCDDCGAVTPDPWHSSNGDRRHYHRCNACHAKAVAQGGVVDVEKVMALVEEYGEQCEAAGYLDRSGSQDASKKLHEAAYQTAVKIRALLSAPPAASGCEQAPGSMYRCKDHGGYGFTADCYMCKLTAPAIANQGARDGR